MVVMVEPKVIRRSRFESEDIRKLTGYGRRAQLVQQCKLVVYDNGMMELTGYLEVDPEHPLIQDHFEGDSMLPLSLLGEFVEQTAYIGLAAQKIVGPKKIRAREMGAKLSEEIRPGNGIVAIVKMPIRPKCRISKIDETEILFFPDRIEGLIYRGYSCELITTRVIGKAWVSAIGLR